MDDLAWDLMSDQERADYEYQEETDAIARHVKSCRKAENDIYCKICNEY